MTAYDANVKIGCLVKAEPLREPSDPDADGVTEWAEDYAMRLPLPGDGEDATPMACPVCSRPYTIRRSSPARASRALQRIFLATAAVGLVVAAALILRPADDTLARAIGSGFAALGCVGLVAAMLCPILPAHLLGSDLVTLRDDPTPFPPPPPGQSGSGGHKILDVHIAEREAKRSL